MKRWWPFLFLLLAVSAFAHAPEPKSVFPSGTLIAAGTANALGQSVSVNNVGADLYTDKTFATTNGLTLSSLVTHPESRLPYPGSRFTVHVSRIPVHVSRITVHVSRITVHVSRITVHPHMPLVTISPHASLPT